MSVDQNFSQFAIGKGLVWVTRLITATVGEGGKGLETAIDSEVIK